jgi:uncharacterized protein
VEDQYVIQFKGLKEGVHHFEFILGNPFFEAFPNLEVPEGKVVAGVALTRNTAFLDLEIRLTGAIRVQCDRCLELFNMDVDYSSHLVVRFSEKEEEGDDELIFLPPEEYRLDLKHYLYEFISVNLPYRKIHPDLPGGESGCDPEMLNKLNDLLVH